MISFYKEHSPKTAKRCRFLCSALKDTFCKCHTCNRRRFSYTSAEEEEETPISYFDDVQEIVSIIRTRAMEAKCRRKGSMLTESYSSIFHPTSGELFVGTPKRQSYDNYSVEKQDNFKEDEEKNDFTSVQSHFSNCSMTSINDNEAFFSVKTNLSCCSSLKDQELAENKWWITEILDSSEIRRRSIIQEVCHCEGWPFGLCRKALLLPPLPKSPSESWSWCKGPTKVIKTN